MTSPAIVTPTEAPADPVRRRGTLALAMQEALTSAVRLRANRQGAADAASFRAHLLQLLSTAEEQARQAGYGQSEIKRAVYAVTVFLDESVLNSGQPVFADWARKPLQEEIFGGHMGGEVFFQNVKDLLGRPDSEDLADLLEVHQLCLLLGFKGRYSLGEGGELRVLMGLLNEKIDRIRGGAGPLAPQWAPLATETIAVARDPWLRRLVLIAGGTAALALVLFLVFTLLLRGDVGTVADLAKKVT
jgi:type VI secretion system protein ImpK